MTSFAERLHRDLLTMVLPSVRNVQAWAGGRASETASYGGTRELVHNLPTRGPDGAS